MSIIELIISVAKVTALLEHLLAPTAGAISEDGRMRTHFLSNTAKEQGQVI